MSESRNPFRYSEPVPPEELLDRDEEARALLERAVDANNSRLVAPRRYGKTSLLRRVAAEARREGWAAVYVDFFGVLTLDDIASARRSSITGRPPATSSPAPTCVFTHSNA